ncbi:MAG: sulfide/dihydroorotate dehydrogenase-like FAD/NAD-binding protein [Candidatus Heimdallarchaeota archaeon]|nr:MAG: sulfide/dihydroorotate dehydrogenase-like FAD/NAD-binding protein [Candidatus Heimdallarchaeota archaeon]
MSSQLWDLVVVGGGPAGLSGAIRAAELGLHVLVLEARSGIATAGSMAVDGYPGFFSITRQELLDKMAKQAKYHATINYAEKVSRLELKDPIKRVYTQVTRGEFFTEEFKYNCRAVLIATGLQPKKLDIPGEGKFKDKGVYYSLPDGDYTDKNVAIIGHTSWAVRNALHYDAIGAHVYLITSRDSFDAHPALMRKLNESFVEVLYSHEALYFEGTDKLTKTRLKSADGKQFSILAEMVLILSSKNTNRELFQDAGLTTTPQGRIIVESSNQDTNIPGVFAAGSATRGDSIVGVGAAEGIKAAEEISRYLTKLEEKESLAEKEKETPMLVERFTEGRCVIIDKKDLSPEIVKWVVKAPLVAEKTQPGQFVILRVTQDGERIPLTVADNDKEKGTITLIFQKIGKSTKLMGTMKAGDHILNLLGPLGRPVKIEKWGTVAVLGGGCGVAPVLPKTKALKEKGNYVVSIISARTSPLLICQEEMREASNELHIATDDGTEGHHGFGLDLLKRFVEEGRHFDHVVAVGPIPMMKFTCAFTKEHNIPTTVSLAPIMVDGTGMCGACRVTVGGEVKFACVDGPNFDGLKVDFEELTLRSRAYLYEERISSGKMAREKP